MNWVQLIELRWLVAAVAGCIEMRIGVVYSEGRVKRRRAEPQGGVCVPPAPPTPLARAHSSTPRAPPAPRHRTTPLPSWDHMFLCNGFCCSPPHSRVLFFVQEVHAPALLFHLLLRYHLTCHVSLICG